jgi:hypothetical protein
MSFVSNGLSGFVETEGKTAVPGIEGERAFLKEPPGGGRKLEGGLWKESVGLVLREFVTVRGSEPAISFGGVMVGGAIRTILQEQRVQVLVCSVVLKFVERGRV